MKTIVQPTRGGKPLPRTLLHELSKPPRAGGGVHSWLFRMARKLHRHLPPAEIIETLAAAVSDCGRAVLLREISDAVTNSKPGCRVEGIRIAGVRIKPAPKWPPVDEALRTRIITDSPLSLMELAAMSPLEIQDCHDANWFLGELFEKEHLICMGLNQSKFTTLPAAEFLAVKLVETCLIVPSPMSAKWGKTRQGKHSCHTLSNTGPRRYLVTEFDSGTADEQAAIINHLRQLAPLTMVVSSGGKSLHAWWNCVGSEEREHRRFFSYAVSVGADPATWTPCQFVRMPQSWRADRNAWQRALFFDPSNLPNAERGAR